MNFVTSIIFSLSIGIGGIIGGVRFRKIDPAFFPFLCLLWAGTANEIVSLILTYQGYCNIANYNLFILAEAVLICYQFRKWELLPRKLFYLLPVSLAILWVTEIALTSVYTVSSYFVVLYSFLFVLMSISLINKMVFKETGPLVKNPVFLICFAFILYFSFSALTETFWIFGIQQSSSFRLHITELFNYVNLFTNLIYAFAILWMPMKQESILPF